MRLGIALGLAAFSGVAMLTACAGQQSLEESARAACVDEGTPAEEMTECVEETTETLRRARELPPPPRQRPPG